MRGMEARSRYTSAFYGDRSSIFQRNDDSWSVAEQLAGKRDPTQFGALCNNSASTSSPLAAPRPKVAKGPFPPPPEEDGRSFEEAVYLMMDLVFGSQPLTVTFPTYLF